MKYAKHVSGNKWHSLWPSLIVSHKLFRNKSYQHLHPWNGALRYDCFTYKFYLNFIQVKHDYAIGDLVKLKLHLLWPQKIV